MKLPLLGVATAMAGFAAVGLSWGVPTAAASAHGGGKPPKTVATAPASALAGALAHPGTSAHFGVRDSAGLSMDTLKVVQVAGTYLGVYHSCVSTCQVRLATSTDLVQWTYRTTLDASASQPYLAVDPSGGYVLAVESAADNHLRLRHYADLSALLTASGDRVIDLARTLSQCAEGTPSITSVTATQIQLRFHYFASCTTDREASGTLTGWSSWSAGAATSFDAALAGAGAAGKHGDRDTVHYAGTNLVVVEGQLSNDDWSTWRLFTYDPATGLSVQVPMSTPNGSTTFANPAITPITTPQGSAALFVSVFMPSEGTVAPDAAGELTFTISVG